MKKYILITLATLILFSGCTQIVTAPISIASTIISSTIDITGSVVRAVVQDNEE
jgi:uncharacterized protein YceK